MSCSHLKFVCLKDRSDINIYIGTNIERNSRLGTGSIGGKSIQTNPVLCALNDVMLYCIFYIIVRIFNCTF